MKKHEWLCEKPPSATRGITTHEYEPKSVGKAPSDEPNSKQIYIESADDELTGEPEPKEDSFWNTNIDYEEDSTQPLERPRREVRAPKYLDEYVRLTAANEQ